MTAVTRDEAPVVFTGEGVEVRTQEMGGGMTVLYMRADQGMDLGPALKGLPDDLCQCPHWGFLTKGRIKLTTKDGEETYEAGQVFYWGPGHSPQALEDSEFFDFSPTEQLTGTLDHVTAQAQQE
ncbi:hypothetical protein GCM10010218_14280 [Streptomyces mashuensis]|uniref:Cupin domain-containing protein n=1 Tax=Streptomyces mashuensis TaxID=33904 RepID=A0A919EAC1_9ACTN|nr:hypothetical protein [Streptomyces mashuensis]GHF34274.1 hypothetical protein GCM10010218_14280 [Streptomyces mashuensis]